MHFPIIALEKIDTPVEDWAVDLPYDDATLHRFTDYAGELYSDEERKRVINSEWFKNLFDGYADVDTEKETITFYSVEKCAESFKRYLREKTEELYNLALDNKLTGFELKWSGVEYNHYPELFYVDGSYVQTSFDFIDDARYYAGETLRIGNIFDAHF